MLYLFGVKEEFVLSLKVSSLAPLFMLQENLCVLPLAIYIALYLVYATRKSTIYLTVENVASLLNVNNDLRKPLHLDSAASLL